MQLPRILLVALLAAPAACGDDGTEPRPPEPRPHTVSRRDPEPAGAHCATGGTAIRAGADLDGNGVLADAEVQTIEYVCGDAPPPAPRSAVRKRAMEPTDDCPGGGAVVETGIDDDGDGALDDAEVDQSAIVCGNAEIWTGDVTDADLGDDGFRSQLARVRVITGSVSSHQTVAVRLPQLQLVAGSVSLTGETTSIELPGLRAIGGNFEVHTPLLGAGLPALERIGGAFAIGSSPGTSPSSTLTAPKLAQVGGDLHVQTSTVGTLDLPGLQHIGGALRLEAGLAGLQLPSLDSVDGNLVIEERALRDLELKALQTVGGGLMVAGTQLQRFAAPVLHAIGGNAYVFPMEHLATLDLHALERIGGFLSVDSVPALTSLDLGLLTSVGGEARVANARNLTRLDLGRLQRASTLSLVATGVETLTTGLIGDADTEVLIAQNPSLRSVTLDLLFHARGVHLDRNPSLASLSLAVLRDVQQLVLSDLPPLARLDARGLTTARTLTLTRVGLVDLASFAAVATLDGLYVHDGGALRSLDGLSRVHHLDVLELDGSSSLTSLIGLDGLRAVSGHVAIANNAVLSGLTGLEHLALVNQLVLRGNPALRDLDGLGSLASIDTELAVSDNLTLASIRGLDALERCATVTFADNPALPVEQIAALRARLDR